MILGLIKPCFVQWQGSDETIEESAQQPPVLLVHSGVLVHPVTLLLCAVLSFVRAILASACCRAHFTRMSALRDLCPELSSSPLKQGALLVSQGTAKPSPDSPAAEEHPQECSEEM